MVSKSSFCFHARGSTDETPEQEILRLNNISKTSRFYIGLAVGLPVFSNISIILTHVQTVLSLQGKATSRNWLNR